MRQAALSAPGLVATPPTAAPPPDPASAGRLTLAGPGSGNPMSNEQQHPSEAPRRGAETAGEDPGQRPDLRAPRGNPEVEPIDVDRGEGKLERVLGW